ncbi:uncharacterized protein EAF01_004700 [Botrytis porri]|uniref:Uncharacterized protein n=1 Tax=Botrytis porri TaxID=87229 RepID=A0A4Z1KK60_9HELO|nr:uncharacterized protein EAF01_004700 [Botrytis porri]KAF7907113.1 hypothetical protein EAF01_004700 [Botrytis porri]TGO81827.1 hypothetical protein BPOR_1002g00020 [Botrytis porri]
MNSSTAIIVYDNTKEVGLHQELPDTSQKGEHTWSETSSPHHSKENEPTSSSFRGSPNSSIGFLDLSLEIRRMVYDEYFVVTEPISFQTGSSASLPFHLDKNYGLQTALLRAKKKIHSEAAPYIYSNRVFNLAGIPPTQLLPTTDAAFAYFSRQISVPNTKLIRHLIIDFPEFNPSPQECYRPEVPKPVEESVRILRQIYDQCKELVTLKMALHELHTMFNLFSWHTFLQNELLATDWLHKQLQGMPFLKYIVIHLQVIDLKRRYHQGWIDKSREYGWDFKVTEYEYKGNKDEALNDVLDAVANLAQMEDSRREMQRGYYIKRQTTDGEFEIDYDLSYRAACRKLEEGLLQSA